MRNTTVKPAWAVALALVAGAFLLALPLAAQKNFNQEEKQTIEKYKRANVHFLKGAEYLKKGKFEKARKEADICLEIFPGYADAHLIIAQLQYQQGALDPALKEIETAKSEFTTFSKFYSYSYQEYLNRLRDERDQAESRINEMSNALSTATSSTEKMRLENQISKAKQNLATLDTRLHDPIPPTPDIPAEYHYIHGNILFKMKRFNEAQELYLAAINADPRHASAYNNLINIYFARNDMADALKYLQQAEANGVTVNEKLKKAILEKRPPQ